MEVSIHFPLDWFWFYYNYNCFGFTMMMEVSMRFPPHSRPKPAITAPSWLTTMIVFFRAARAVTAGWGWGTPTIRPPPGSSLFPKRSNSPPFPPAMAVMATPWPSHKPARYTAGGTVIFFFFFFGLIFFFLLFFIFFSGDGIVLRPNS